MVIDLSDEEIAIIQDWYNSAAGESATLSSFEYTTRPVEEIMAENLPIIALIKRLGLTVHFMDEKKLEQSLARVAS